MNPQPKRHKGEKAVHDRLYHAAQVSLQQKLMKQRQQALIDKNRPNSSRPLNTRKDDPVLNIQKVDMLDAEFDEEGN